MNNSYIYIYHVNVTQTVPDISPLMPMHQDPLLVLLFCEDPKFVNRPSCEHFVKISWQLLMRSRAVIWHPGDYFVTSYCDEWQLFDGFLTTCCRFCEDVQYKWRLCDSYRIVIWWLWDYFVTSIYEGTTIQQLYDSPTNPHMTTLWPCCVMWLHSDNSWYWKQKITNLTNLSS